MTRKSSKPASSAAKSRKSARRSTKPPKTKRDTIIGMLRRPKGASIADLTSATGWQAHSVRAALTGLRKRDIDVVRTNGTDSGTVYRIGGAVSS